MTAEEVAEHLADFLQRSHAARGVRIERLRILTGGADQNVILRSGVRHQPGGATKKLATPASISSLFRR